MRFKLMLPAAVAAITFAHPMGNFSVNHYARLEPAPGGLHIRYVMDLAEIPTFELFQQWGEGADPNRKVAEQARIWARGLDLRVDGVPVAAHLKHAAIALSEGAANMQVARVVADFTLASAGGTLSYEDRNYRGRSGWKEIVTGPARDRSAELTAYPQNPLIAPPQDLRVTYRWTALPASPAPAPATLSQSPAPAPVTPPAPSTVSAPGAVVKGDYLSQLLHRREIGWDLTLIGMAVAFGLGAVHALSPGHGKTIVAAYLVGSRGSFKHAALLGAMVTFTHTASVFLLGFVTLFLSKYILPDKLVPILGVVSGISIVWVGATLFVRRLRGQRAHHHHHHHHGHTHDHHHHDHSHAHSHVPQGDVTLGSLIALGASGGLVPCPSALVLLLSAISLGRTGLGIVLLTGFSAGLACVLMGLGMIVLYAGNLLPTRRITGSRAFRLMPVASAALITCVGAVMTVASLA